MDKYTNEKVMRSLNSLKKRINRKFKLEKMILFGSRARGDYFLTSDVDLILVSNDFAKFEFRERIAEILDYWDEGIDIEPLCYTPEEFERKKKQIGIVKQAVEEGVNLLN